MTHLRLSVYLLAVFVRIISVVDEYDGPTVMTTAGIVRGLKRPAVGNHRTVYAFTGIPFAKPPIGTLRFRKPQPIDPWQGVFNATQQHPACVQSLLLVPRRVIYAPFALPQSEDCLFLNVWTEDLNPSSRRNVMVWIYGGAFYYGAASMPIYDGGALAAVGEVVVVSMNYRLGSLGFLYAGMSDIPGNQGLYDQALALSWVRENIEQFGGNSNKITLFGGSAGGLSVMFHLASPLTRDLIHKAIVQSGGFISTETTEDGSVLLEKANLLARLAGCGKETNSTTILSSETVQCLETLDVQTLTSLETTLYSSKQTFFTPRHGEEFLPRALSEGSLPGDKDVMIGHNANEGTTDMYVAFPDTFPHFSRPRRVSKTETLYYLGFMYPSLRYRALREVQNVYMGHLESTNYAGLRKALANSLGDASMICRNLQTAERVANASTAIDNGAGVYYYVFNYKQRCSDRQPWVGVTHGDELLFVFGEALKNQACASDVHMSLASMKLWSSFAKMGNPGAVLPRAWPKFKTESPEALNLDSTTFSVVALDIPSHCEVFQRIGVLPSEPGK